ncbi:MAG: NUDIX hydrolase [Candidatus Abyssobacteria bacterium SURF_5]|uniref:GDP-mannose pyrophosphatase n=1 Tax=Abyssobacteria bacterium (strain SURF_5) TaxID=2093360 RepID=A0A3A4P7E7_ABYX5|nr:MAG: NUDIX hydrolase [Candidatus Abyssubacteria bacterium SURF_5]
MRQWKTHARRVVLDEGRYLRVEHHDIELPGGRMLHDWPWLVTPDYVNILAVTDQGRFLCFRQTKYAVEGLCLAPPGGYIDAGEDPLMAARRELLEETGYQASEWVALGHLPVDGNRGAGTAHLFLALQAQEIAEIDSDDLEEQKLLLLTRNEVENALAAGEFKVLAWATVVALGLLHLEGRVKFHA